MNDVLPEGCYDSIFIPHKKRKWEWYNHSPPMWFKKEELLVLAGYKEKVEYCGTSRVNAEEFNVIYEFVLKLIKEKEKQ